jgi:hypothetical protein
MGNWEWGIELLAAARLSNVGTPWRPYDLLFRGSSYSFTIIHINPGL